MGSKAFTTGLEAGQQGENQNQISTGFQIGDNTVTVSDSGAIGAAVDLGTGAFSLAEDLGSRSTNAAVDLGTGAFDLSRQITSDAARANDSFLETSSSLFTKFADILSASANRSNEQAGRIGEALTNLVSKQTTGETVTADKNRSWVPYAFGLGALFFAFLILRPSKPSKA